MKTNASNNDKSRVFGRSRTGRLNCTIERSSRSGILRHSAVVNRKQPCRSSAGDLYPTGLFDIWLFEVMWLLAKILATSLRLVCVG